MHVYGGNLVKQTYNLPGTSWYRTQDTHHGRGQTPAGAAPPASEPVPHSGRSAPRLHETRTPVLCRDKRAQLTNPQTSVHMVPSVFKLLPPLQQEGSDSKAQAPESCRMGVCQAFPLRFYLFLCQAVATYFPSGYPGMDSWDMPGRVLWAPFGNVPAVPRLQPTVTANG